ncbi:MAG: hypothetical protein IKT22_05760 [Prevotella sp.]|nr:hypothetical protein [Prevotella sp.]
MNTRKIITLLLAMAFFAPTMAQKRKSTKKTAAPKPVVIEETPAQRLYKAMLPATAKVMFIDSVVVDKQGFLSQIPLGKDAGKISTFEQFFDRPAQVELGVFQNEFGDRCYYADGDTLATRLYSIDRLGNNWSKPRELTEFGPDYKSPNFPFLLSDGITLFFAAKGEHSIGGYDIFMTLYDSENGVFYRPENYGLPFNSTANDYFVAIDEVNELGYLVSDRHQPDDKVCIYIFEPTSPRVSFESEDLSNEQLRRYANLVSIDDTWPFGNRSEALQRYQTALGNQSSQTAAKNIAFVIDDNTIYRSTSQFRSPQSRELYQKYAALAASIDTDERTLSLQREKFAKASAREQRQMRETMLRLEHQLTENQEKIKQIAKEIRYIELKIKN